MLHVGRSRLAEFGAAYLGTHRLHVAQDVAAIAGGIIGTFFALVVIAAVAVAVILFLKRNNPAGTCD